MVPLSEGEAAIEFGLVGLFCAAVLLQGNFLTWAATLLNAGFLAWVVSCYHSELFVAGTTPLLELLILGGGIVAMLVGFQYRRETRQQRDKATSASSPAPAVPITAEPSPNPHRQSLEHPETGLSIIVDDGEVLDAAIQGSTDRRYAPPAERRNGTLRRASDLKRESSVLELRHRLSNLFPTITALANLMDTPDGDVADYRRALIERIRALQAAHQLLTRHPTRTGLLQDIVTLTLKPYRQEHNITIHGPSIPMSEGTAESFALVVHELATNSLKHGALGTPGGHVSVEWSMPANSDGDILFMWSEQGRRRMAKSAHLGFGSSILGTCGPPLIGHSPSVEMSEDGMRYSLCLSRNDGTSSSSFL